MSRAPKPLPLLEVPRGDLPDLAPALCWKPVGSRLVVLWCGHGHVSRITAAVSAAGDVAGEWRCPAKFAGARCCEVEGALRLLDWPAGDVEAVRDPVALLEAEARELDELLEDTGAPRWTTQPTPWLATPMPDGPVAPVVLDRGSARGATEA